MHPTTSPLFPLPHPSPPHPFFLILSASPLFSISSTCYFHFPTPPFPAASPHPANSSFYHIRCLFPSPIHHLLNSLLLLPSPLVLPSPPVISCFQHHSHYQAPAIFSSTHPLSLHCFIPTAFHSHILISHPPPSLFTNSIIGKRMSKRYGEAFGELARDGNTGM